MISVPRNQLSTPRSFHVDFSVKKICHFIAFPEILFSLFCLLKFFLFTLKFRFKYNVFSFTDCPSNFECRLVTSLSAFVLSSKNKFSFKGDEFRSFTFQHFWLLKKREKLTLICFVRRCQSKFSYLLDEKNSGKLATNRSVPCILA